ncbi:MAG: GNAT family N-acetyltransferase [Candidatus Thalassarchaeaceae archaeon]|nr:GNAT family N-acetyltransferase [Candidatus Thalassarchaeaceae archaeon]
MGDSFDPSNTSKKLGFIFSPEIIVDDNLSIVAPTFEDASELFQLVDGNREYLREWLPWLDSNLSIVDEINFIEISIKDRLQGSSGVWLIRENGNLVGNISINWVDWDNRSCGLGYWISRDKSGNGIVTRCCESLINNLIFNNKIHRFVIEAGINNIASRKIAEKLGMRLEGVIKDRELLYDVFTDGALYAITAPEWALRVQ